MRSPKHTKERGGHNAPLPVPLETLSRGFKNIVKWYGQHKAAAERLMDRSLKAHPEALRKASQKPSCSPRNARPDPFRSYTQSRSSISSVRCLWCSFGRTQSETGSPPAAGLMHTDTPTPMRDAATECLQHYCLHLQQVYPLEPDAQHCHDLIEKERPPVVRQADVVVMEGARVHHPAVSHPGTKPEGKEWHGREMALDSG